jgi:hypothetical protein
MKRRRQRQWNSCSLWERWVLATSIASFIGLAIVGVVSVVLSRVGYIQGTFTLIGALEGIILGFAQWLVLRRYIQHSAQWIVATVIGALLAWFTGLTISTLMALVYAGTSDITVFIKGLVLLGGGLGGVLGFCQWLVLRTQIRFSIWWVVANTFAWALASLVAFVGAGMVRDGLSIQTTLITVATGATMGAVIGGITGITLVWLLKARKKLT